MERAQPPSVSARVDRAARAVTIALVMSAACAPQAQSPTQPWSAHLRATSGPDVTFPADLRQAKLTVLVFFAHGCPCVRAHDGRLREMARLYRPRGVKVFLVDSEIHATMDRDQQTAHERDLPPILLDTDATLAHAFGAKHATYSVILDEEGHVRYRGGFDSDKNRLTDQPQNFLRDAIDDLLDGRGPRQNGVKTLGCALETR